MSRNTISVSSRVPSMSKTMAENGAGRKAWVIGTLFDGKRQRDGGGLFRRGVVGKVLEHVIAGRGVLEIERQLDQELAIAGMAVERDLGEVGLAADGAALGGLEAEIEGEAKGVGAVRIGRVAITHPLRIKHHKLTP